jgi:Methyltransferase domain
MRSSKAHWEGVYRTKQPNEVSWTQEIPKISLEFIHSFNLPKSASIIDIGGGDSKLVDYLINEGFKDITIVDISGTSLERAKMRLGKRADKAKWEIADIMEFNPSRHFDVWHDRATFHFLTTSGQINKYLTIARSCVSKYLIVGTFSENGPDKCSGLPIKKYSEDQLQTQLSEGFFKLKCVTEIHVTPMHTKQYFLFCSFKKS